MHTLVRYDNSGDLHDNAFFELSIPLPDWRLFFPNEARIGIWSWRNEECITSLVQTTSSELHLCSVNPSHVSEYIFTPSGVDLSNTGSELTYFLPNIAGEEYAVCSARFVEAISDQKFLGYGFLPLDILSCDPVDIEVLGVSIFEFRGAACKRKAKVILPEPNTCPFCNFEPIVCPSCLKVPLQCPYCHGKVAVIDSRHEGEEDVRFLVESPPKEGFILDGRSWDGSDFIPGGGGVGFVSSRVVHWMMREDIWPFWAKPARFDITGMRGELKSVFDELLSVDLSQ